MGRNRPVELIPMRIVRYLAQEGNVRYAAEEPSGRCFDLTGDIYHAFEVTDHEAQMVNLLAPVEPRVLLCIGLNYRDHAEEQGSALPQWPMLFIKSPNSLNHPGDPIAIPTHLTSTEVDYEGELAVVIGRDCKNIRRASALDYILGYTVANDVTARDWQKKYGGGQFCRGKSFDSFAPLGPVLLTKDEITDVGQLRIQTRVNGETRQDSNTSNLIFDIPTLIEFLSGSTTLLAGSVILTGTPSGVGMAMKPPRFLQPGDVVEVEIENIGVLSNPVVKEY
jgi:2-keto-4-pentenoate hydratase/2-oxohepta-3-ene-1,7-dioic acid hydratase in catechol pathway